MILESCTEMATSTNQLHKNKQYFIVEFIYLICTSYEFEQQQKKKIPIIAGAVHEFNANIHL